MGLNLAIAGATGAVGNDLIYLLEKRGFEVSSLKLLASKRSVGKTMNFKGTEIKVEELTHDAFEGVDLAFFSAGASRSKEFCPSAVKAGAVVIDNSSAFRMDEGVPLVVPEVNPDALKSHQGLIANPNCTTIQMVMALKPLHAAATITKVRVATYQSVSGSGQQAIVELENQVKQWVADQEITKDVYPVQIAFNLIPQVDVFFEDGYTKEEMKMVFETRKIMDAPDMQISATCVRVPVFRTHSEAVWIETEKKLSADQARELFRKGKNIRLKDDKVPGGYPTPLDAVRSFDTWIGRVREDPTATNGLTFWVVADQIYKGAGLNAIQIAETMLEMGLLKG